MSTCWPCQSLQMSICLPCDANLQLVPLLGTCDCGVGTSKRWSKKRFVDATHHYTLSYTSVYGRLAVKESRLRVQTYHREYCRKFCITQSHVVLLLLIACNLLTKSVYMYLLLVNYKHTNIQSVLSSFLLSHVCNTYT